MEFNERRSQTVCPICSQKAQEGGLSPVAAAVGSSGGRVVQGMRFEKFVNDYAVMKSQALGNGLETAEAQGLRATSVIKIRAGETSELSGKSLVLGKFAADGEGIANENASGVGLRGRGRIMEPEGIRREIGGMIA